MGQQGEVGPAWATNGSRSFAIPSIYFLLVQPRTFPSGAFDRGTKLAEVGVMADNIPSRPAVEARVEQLAGVLQC